MTLFTPRQRVIQAAHSWLGTPYHHLANVKGVGVDCAMLLVEVYKSAGLISLDLDPRPYSPEWHLHRGEEKFLGWLLQYGQEIATPRSGDVAVWKFGRAFSHGAVVVSDFENNDATIVHAYKDARVVTLGNLSEALLASRARKFFAIKGIDNGMDAMILSQRDA